MVETRVAVVIWQRRRPSVRQLLFSECWGWSVDLRVWVRGMLLGSQVAGLVSKRKWILGLLG